MKRMKRNCRNSINEPLDITRQHPQFLPNGCRHCFIDVTELQARVIIWLGSREMEGSSPERISSFWLQSQALMCEGGANGGLSLKKSLHTFLQKRKKRTQQITTESQCDDNG
ncbi:hypothetical protein K1719_026701 [Acacia pycnantha]|nr:hypothetical protein K1719_026701 [Acacia pycnantha]